MEASRCGSQYSQAWTESAKPRRECISQRDPGQGADGVARLLPSKEPPRRDPLGYPLPTSQERTLSTSLVRWARWTHWFHEQHRATYRSHHVARDHACRLPEQGRTRRGRADHSAELAGEACWSHDGEHPVASTWADEETRHEHVKPTRGFRQQGNASAPAEATGLPVLPQASEGCPLRIVPGGRRVHQKAPVRNFDLKASKDRGETRVPVGTCKRLVGGQAHITSVLPEGLPRAVPTA